MKNYPRLPEISSSRVRDMPKQMLPRERMEKDGVESLSDEELLAVLLSSGTKGFSVLDLAQALIKRYGSLNTLAECSIKELHAFPGLKRVKAQKLKAALELARRMGTESKERQVIRTPEDVVRLLRAAARGRAEEIFWMLPLDAKYRLKRPAVEVTSGIADASLAHPREVFREAICFNSSAVVLVHNHPSGDPTPSAEDIRLTRELVAAGKVVGIPVLDHVILAGNTTAGAREFVSLREAGLVTFDK